jgi:transposase-like protein
MTVSLVARRHGVAPNQLFTWRRLVTQGALTAAGSGEEVVPASDYRALQSQVRELQRLLGKKTLEAEILKEAFEHATGSKKPAAAAAVEGRFPMNTVAEVIGVSRSPPVGSRPRPGRPADLRPVFTERPILSVRIGRLLARRQEACRSARPHMLPDDRGFTRRSSSAWPKYADALRRIWRNSRFSRSKAFNYGTPHGGVAFVPNELQHLVIA